jgi:hypothetical protein
MTDAAEGKFAMVRTGENDGVKQLVILSINPEAASLGDIGRLAAELMEANRQVKALTERVRELEVMVSGTLRLQKDRDALKAKMAMAKEFAHAWIDIEQLTDSEFEDEWKREVEEEPKP